MPATGRAGRAVSVRVDGLREAKASLADVPEAYREAIAETLKRGSEIIETEAKARVRKRSGELAESIATNIRDDGLMAATGSGLPRARWIELGTSRSNGKRYPFLFPAFKRGARLVRKEMRDWGAAAERKVRFKTKRFKPKPAET
jgi:hypothetical protein